MSFVLQCHFFLLLLQIFLQLLQLAFPLQKLLVSARIKTHKHIADRSMSNIQLDRKEYKAYIFYLSQGIYHFLLITQHGFF